MLCVFDSLTGKVTVVPGIDTALYTPGQPVWVPAPAEAGPGTYRLLYTRWSNQPRRLGMIYCFQRPCGVCSADLSTLLTAPEAAAGEESVVHYCLTESLPLARSPRVTPSGQHVVFIGRHAAMDTHQAQPRSTF